MSRDPLRVPNYLDHIVDSIDRIFRYCAGLDENEFFSNQLIQDAVIRNFAVIGEALLEPTTRPHAACPVPP